MVDLFTLLTSSHHNGIYSLRRAQTANNIHILLVACIKPNMFRRSQRYLYLKCDRRICPEGFSG